MKFIITLISILFFYSFHSFGQTSNYGQLFVKGSTYNWIYSSTGDETTDGKYVGEIKNGLPHGQGVFDYSPKYGKGKYVGNFIDGKFHGEGIMTFPDGGQFIGNFHEGRMNGRGKITNTDGSVLEGEWFNDTPYNTSGVRTTPWGGRLIGTYKNGSEWDIVWYDMNGKIVKQWVKGIEQ